jgi:CBS domain containing-hemolysin-like protein
MMAGGFVITMFAATAAYILQECSWHELKEYCQQQRKPDVFGRIFDLRDQMHLGAVILQMIATAIAACSAVGWLLKERSFAELETSEMLSILAVVAFGLIVCSGWVPWAIERIGSNYFLFHTWRWLWIVSAFAWPFLVGARVVSALFVRASGKDHDDDEEEAFEDEILAMVSEGEHDGFLERDTRDMIEGVMELDDTDVAAVMTPRSKIDALEADTTWDDALEFVVNSGRTRIPVYDGKIDNITGILYAKDILRESLRSESKRRPIAKLLREPIVVPDSTLLDEMLNKFLRNHVHLAVVQDEYGGLAGIVTIEDVLEEIVGEIVDETDDELADEIEVLNEYEANVEGSVHIDQLNERLGLTLPEDQDYDTVSGMIMSELKEVPRSGHELTIGNVHFTIQQASRRSIDLVRVTVLDDEEGSSLSGRSTGSTKKSG